MKPSVDACSVCTLDNPIDFAACDACGTPRPPMEQIVAEFQRAMGGGQEEKAEEKEEKEVEKGVEEVRMEELVKELGRIVSREEQRVVREKR